MMVLSCPQMARADAGHHVGQQFSLIEKYTAAAKRAVGIPVVAKMTPNITDMVPAALAAQVSLIKPYTRPAPRHVRV